MTRHYLMAAVLAAASLDIGVFGQDFNVCKPRAEMIWHGNDTFGFTPEQIGRFLYRGPVIGMNPSFDRSTFVTLTTEGKSLRMAI